MNYISVKEASEKFNISERRIQKLCETQRIQDCKKVSGIWLIPENVQKPIDNRCNLLSTDNDTINLQDLCNYLSISYATGRNWIKLGKITPQYTEKYIPYFDKKYAITLKNEIAKGTNESLKSRRNKKFITGNSLYNFYISEESKNIKSVQKLLAEINNSELLLCEDYIQYFVADCAIKLLLQSKKINYSLFCLKEFLENRISIREETLINELIEDKIKATIFIKKYSRLFEIDYYQENEDILGLLYISLKNIGNRKATGSYYTPTKIVKKLISSLNFNFSENEKILDPCCGTGNFLLQLPNKTSFNAIFANDIDATSIKIARINMSLKFPNISINEIKAHITNKNFLTDYNNSSFSFIIGNPPWGYNFTKDENIELKKMYNATDTAHIESYDVFIEHSLQLLKQNGKLSFVLPEAILNVKAHSVIRNIIISKTNIKEISYLGNAFDGVQCPCIILQLENTNKKLSTKGLLIYNEEKNFLINTERKVSSNCFSFNMNDIEYAIIQKIKNRPDCVFLHNNADFALGIVTGNNKKIISKEKTTTNEIILKGSDIYKFHINKSNNYIDFIPDNFQQVAPTKFYRAKEKLFYRFICNQLVFAYDDKQTLSLNSCNILIPNINNLDVKYIMAILNSRIAQFLFKKEFNSIKILRAHIESIPIPKISNIEQKNIINLVNKIAIETSSIIIQEIYDELDSEICRHFNITKDEQIIIKNSVYKDNLFLF